MHRQSEKNLLSVKTSSTWPRNMVNFGPPTAEIGSGVWGTQQISTGFASLLRYCSDVPHRRPTKLCMMFGRFLGWYTIYISLGGSCPLTEFYPVQNSLCVQVLRSPTSFIGSVTARHSSSGRQPNCGDILYLWSPYGIGQTIIFSSCFFPLSFFFLFFPRLISAAGDWMFTILWHMVWP